jgi:hypothetical protein
VASVFGEEQDLSRANHAGAIASVQNAPPLAFSHEALLYWRFPLNRPPDESIF